MKIKNWLVWSHLIVMLAPILTVLMLYNLIMSYNKKTELKDYLTASAALKNYESKLSTPEIYKNPKVKQNFVNQGDEKFVVITLYNVDGQVIYDSSNSQSYTLSKDLLYSKLYEVQSGYKAYSLKKPVFDKGSLVGFYKVVIARKDFISSINNNTNYAIACFVFILIAVFILVIVLLNRKFNQPLKLLIKSMRSFGQGVDAEINYETKDEIGELITHFRSMKKELVENKRIIEEQQKTKEYMISAISHDLKTPLTSIRAYAEGIYNDKEVHLFAVRDKASVIISKSDYMKKMLDDLMVYTLLTSDYKLELVEVDGVEFFDMLLSNYNELCQEKQINLITDISVDGIYEVDVKQMMRVSDNLITNAIRYTPYSGDICIGAFSLKNKLPSWLESNSAVELQAWKSDGCVILVKNNGEIIKNEEKTKIFMPFYQVDDARSKTSHSGVGLGLSIVNLVIQRHGGEVKVISENGNTLFACWIPNKII